MAHVRYYTRARAPPPPMFDWIFAPVVPPPPPTVFGIDLASDAMSSEEWIVFAVFASLGLLVIYAILRMGGRFASDFVRIVPYMMLFSAVETYLWTLIDLVAPAWLPRGNIIGAVCKRVTRLLFALVSPMTGGMLAAVAQ